MSETPTTRRHRELRPGQRCAVWIAALDTPQPRLVLETDDLLLEAPNWSPSGDLLLNGAGGLWRLGTDEGAEPTPVPLSGVPGINNDHVISADGTAIYLSAYDGQLYRAPIDGGTAIRLTDDEETAHYLHGVSPDGTNLTYVRMPRGRRGEPGRLAILPVDGGESTVLDTGEGHLDGPEYSPDGAWIYFNTEEFTDRPGHAQLARVPAAGGRMERLTDSETVDWFPHLAPDGRHACYLAYPPGTQGHPPDLDVEIRVVTIDGTAGEWARPRATYPLHGGQGTINVNSWAPDGTRFAFVSYPTD